MSVIARAPKYRCESSRNSVCRCRYIKVGVSVTYERSPVLLSDIDWWWDVVLAVLGAR